MVERAEGLLRPHAALSIELPKTLFGLGIRRKHRVSRVEVLGLQGGDALELSLSIGGRPARQVLGDLVQRQTFICQPIADQTRTDRCSQFGHQFGQLSRREVRPQEILLIGIARRVRLQDRLQILDEFRLGLDPFFRPAPARRTRPSAGS